MTVARLILAPVGTSVAMEWYSLEVVVSATKEDDERT